MNQKIRLLFVALVILTTGGRAVSFGTALSIDHSPGQYLDQAARKANPRQGNQRPATMEPLVPHAVSFRDVPGRGLIVKAWINSTGPFNFAIDTGAGATLLSPRVADEARVRIQNGNSDRASSIAGLSGRRVAAQRASIERIAIGDSENYLPGRGAVLITSGLPSDVDGLIDPTEVFSPFGYVIDLPQRELSSFNARISPIRISEQPEGGAVVPWLSEAGGRRPFVKLENGDRALIDTGSSFGLVIRDSGTERRKAPTYSVRDVGGGQISSTPMKPVTIEIGTLTLQRIPTDLIAGAEANAPVLLGLRALRPFRLAFDPVHRLIEIAPSR
jgi:hypothetical protein